MGYSRHEQTYVDDDWWDIGEVEEMLKYKENVLCSTVVDFKANACMTD